MYFLNNSSTCKMSTICRLCLHKYDSDSLKNIFEFAPKYFEINLIEIIYWIFDVEVSIPTHYLWKNVRYKT